MNFISLLKRLPIDVGQAERKHDSAGKLIAFSFVGDGTDKRALDIGCRDGYWSERLKEVNYDVESLDLVVTYKDALKHDVEKGIPFKDADEKLIGLIKTHGKWTDPA